MGCTLNVQYSSKRMRDPLFSRHSLFSKPLWRASKTLLQLKSVNRE